jgi:prolipoprotein diacylglyceryltransferase
MLPVLNIGPLAIQTPGLVLLLGIWIGLSLAERYAHLFHVVAAQLYNVAFIALLAGIVGARLGYAARFPAAFAASPASLVSLNPGLLDPLGGFVVGTLAALIYGQRRSLSFWPLLDALTPVLIVFNIALALSQLAAGTAFGLPTDLPWAIELWGAARHPTQVYQLLAALFVLAVLWPGRKRLRERPPGFFFGAFLALAAGSRLVLDGFRADGLGLVGGFRLEQILAWLTLAAALFLLGRRQNRSDRTRDQLAE